jgi:GNAT superfamily N-acetyltransferase
VRPPEALNDRHDIAGFDCGKPELNRWLAERARSSEGRTARTFVVSDAGHVVAFYSLSTGSIIRSELPRKLRHDTPEAVPILVMGRLAVDLRSQGRGLGKALLRDAIMRALSISAEVGFLALVVHVIDESAIPFYTSNSFIPSPTNPRTFVLPLATARSAI